MIWLWVWGIVSSIALIAEFLSSHLVTIWFAVGGLTTLLVVALAPGLFIVWQILIFAGVSIILLICLRKVCLKYFNNSNKQ
jgi:membrane protein implicated in regulation of membrane protease activity